MKEYATSLEYEQSYLHKKQEEKSNEGNLFEVLLRERIQKNRK